MAIETIPLYDPALMPATALTHDQLVDRETAMMTELNWRDDHTVPSAGGHYRYMWLWDSAQAAVINARRDDPERAATEIKTLVQYVDEATGFLPNKIFATADGKTWRDYPEAWNFNNNKIGTSYTQPPITAWAAMETYNSFERLGRVDEGLDFLRSIYGTAEEGNFTGLQGEYAYFKHHRQNGPYDPLIGIVHPNETGRDSDPANKLGVIYGNKKPGAQREWLQMQKLGWDLGRLGRDPNKQRIDWIPEQVRGKYWVNDVMFNSMYAHNLRTMADIAGLLSANSDDAQDIKQYSKDIGRYREHADEVEGHILARMWDEEHGFFYNLDGQGRKIPVESITGLFPLMLENLGEEKASALEDKLEDETWFATPYPIPTNAVRSEFFDPFPKWFDRTFTPPWSGTVWPSMNTILVEEGMVPRAEGFAASNSELSRRMLGRAGIIAANTVEMVASSADCMEAYSSITGEGMRIEKFFWPNLALHFANLEAATARASA